MTYDDAVTALYQASVEAFVAERKRLAGELKAGGDKTGAAKLAKLGRPTLSAWAVNQLWWHARDAFEALFETAERIRGGELAAQLPHREALANLRGRAARMLTDGGHNANEATLRRVTTSLSALAAGGGFSPDAPGALAEDREPLGFDVALSLASVPVRHDKPKPAPPPEVAAKTEPDPQEEEEEIDEEEEAARREAAQRELDGKPSDNDAANENENENEAKPAKRGYEIGNHKAANEQATESKTDKQREHEAVEAAKRAAETEKRREHEAAEQKRTDEKEARTKAAAERSKLIANLATAQSELARRKRAVDTLSQQLEIAEQQVAEAEAIIAALQAKLEGHA